MMAPHGIQCDCSRCHHLGPPLDPIRLAADPLWTPQPEGNPFYVQLCAAYDADVAFTLWETARELVSTICDRCKGTGTIFDHSSLDPQQRWDDDCPDCEGLGTIPTAAEAAA